MIALPPIARLATRPERAVAAMRCELCTKPLGDVHRHLVEVGGRVEVGAHTVICACTACAILFVQATGAARYRTVPDRVRIDSGFSLRPDQLGIPVGLAFCFRDSSVDEVIACYPGPAGIVEAELAPEAWERLAAATRLTTLLEPDVEALLVRSLRGSASSSCYLVPITTAYELAARLRKTWSGFTGGDAAERELAAFFAELDARGAPA